MVAVGYKTNGREVILQFDFEYGSENFVTVYESSTLMSESKKALSYGLNIFSDNSILIVSSDEFRYFASEGTTEIGR